MRLVLLLAPLIAACSPPAPEPDSGSAVIFETVGRLQSDKIDEASGLAHSQRHKDLLWVINDDGDAEIHAIDGRGANLGRVNVSKIRNNDWEDLSSFTLEGKPYVLIAAVSATTTANARMSRCMSSKNRIPTTKKSKSNGVSTSVIRTGPTMQRRLPSTPKTTVCSCLQSARYRQRCTKCRCDRRRTKRQKAKWLGTLATLAPA